MNPWEYWEGAMNWPLHPDWKCIICGERGLIWGLQHGVCRCFTCHAIYYMRPNGKVTDKPVSLLKDKEAAQQAWQKWTLPLDEIPEEYWDEVL